MGTWMANHQNRHAAALLAAADPAALPSHLPCRTRFFSSVLVVMLAMFLFVACSGGDVGTSVLAGVGVGGLLGLASILTPSGLSAVTMVDSVAVASLVDVEVATKLVILAGKPPYCSHVAGYRRDNHRRRRHSGCPAEIGAPTKLQTFMFTTATPTVPFFHPTDVTWTPRPLFSSMPKKPWFLFSPPFTCADPPACIAPKLPRAAPQHTVPKLPVTKSRVQCVRKAATAAWNQVKAVLSTAQRTVRATIAHVTSCLRSQSPAPPGGDTVATHGVTHPPSPCAKGRRRPQCRAKYRWQYRRRRLLSIRRKKKAVLRGAKEHIGSTPDPVAVNREEGHATSPLPVQHTGIMTVNTIDGRMFGVKVTVNATVGDVKATIAAVLRRKYKSKHPTRASSICTDNFTLVHDNRRLADDHVFTASTTCHDVCLVIGRSGGNNDGDEDEGDEWAAVRAELQVYGKEDFEVGASCAWSDRFLLHVCVLV